MNNSQILLDAIKSGKITPSDIDASCETINDAIEFIEFMSEDEIENALNSAGVTEDTGPSYSEMAEQDREDRIRRARDMGLTFQRPRR